MFQALKLLTLIQHGTLIHIHVHRIIGLPESLTNCFHCIHCITVFALVCVYYFTRLAAIFKSLSLNTLILRFKLKIFSYLCNTLKYVSTVQKETRGGFLFFCSFKTLLLPRFIEIHVFWSRLHYFDTIVVFRICQSVLKYTPDFDGLSQWWIQSETRRSQ